MAASAAIRGVTAGILLAACVLWGNHRLSAAEAPADREDQPAPAARQERIPTPAPQSPAEDPTLSPAPPCDMGCDGGGPCGPYGPCGPWDDGACWGGWCLCGPPGQFWLHADYMLWWTKGSHVPPLVTTSPTDTPRAQAGVLGEPNTTVLFGNSRVNEGSRSGFRVSGGSWLNPCRTWALQGDYFDSGGRSTDYFSGNSNGNPILVRPLFNVAQGQSAGSLVAFPGVITGSMNVHAEDYFQSVGATLRPKLLCRQAYGYDLCGHCGFRLDMLGGYRYYRLSDGVSMREQATSIDPESSLIEGTTFDIEDSFQVRNDFHGGELGLSAQLFRGRWSLELQAKAALGNNRQVASLNGSTLVTVPSEVPGGQPSRFALNSGTLVVSGNGFNAGEHFRDTFTVIPNFEAQLGFQWNCHLRTYVGYNLFYWSGITRAGELINLSVNGSNPPQPSFEWHRASLFAQGLNAGLEFRY